MTKSIGWLAIGGIFSFVSAAGAQTLPLSTATTAFDGTYAFVSSTQAPPENARCGNRIGGPLVVVQGRAEFTNLLGHSHIEGTIGSQGELAMRAQLIAHAEAFDVFANGRIDRDGTVRVRMTGPGCSYDVVWQKEHK
jgi:hypothetical protein